MYVKIEAGRLDYLRLNQENIRADWFQGLVDSAHIGLSRGSDVGKRVVLPSSFIGGPRDMQRRYLDAMTLVRKFGKPDLFLTMTCNPNWPEIQNELKPFELAQNRPDLTARIFKAKVEELKNDIVDRAVFGPVAAYVYVIEFQKRGLPHVHFLVVLKPSAKISTAEQVDKIICAEIPPQSTQLYLHSVVLKHMIHGPCGLLNPKNICMKKNGRCKDQYPRDFCEKTIVGNEAFPIYQRSSNSPVAMVRNVEVDNRWVVPYNPFLLAKYNCHFNIEVCSSIKAVKYLYKYIYKGHDRVAFRLENGQDVSEINAFQQARWISPPEAAWRIYGFTLNEMHPHVYSMQVHLPGYHQVSFVESSNIQRLLAREETAKSMLTEYFMLNQRSTKARSLLYKELPQYFVWDKSAKKWFERKKKQVVGRLVAVGPAEGERYYLRLLLSHIKGAKSFVDLRTINSTICETFREACLLHGLLQNDDHYGVCFEEAASYGLPCQLRHLFAVILSFCEPENPKSIWLRFKEEMCSDFRSQQNSQQDSEMLTLRELKHMLELMGKDINQYGLTPRQVRVDLADQVNKFILDENQIQVPEQDFVSAELLNAEQINIFRIVMNAVTEKKSLLVFVDGPGGTGKTFLYRTILAHVRRQGLIALATASSGVAAGILPGGRTAHFRFKIPLEISPSMQCNVGKQSALAFLLKSASVIIWDEAPMMHRFAVESVDRLFRDLMSSQIPFGGKIILLGGDFRQVLPVIPRGTHTDISNAALVHSYLWGYFTKYKLTHNMRAQDDDEFSHFLLRIGDGTEETDGNGNVTVPNDFLISYIDEASSMERLIETVFPNLNGWETDYEDVVNRAILTPKNECVDSINNMLIDSFPGEAYTYYSFDSALETTEHTFQPDFLNTLAPNGIPPHELKLKINAPIMLLRNLNSAEGLSNGTRLICCRFHKNLIEAEISVGPDKGKRVFLPRIPFIPSETQQNPFTFRRNQFPIRLSFAMTINKAQGQTLDFVGLYLPKPVFSHGQLYVAFSRVKNKNSLKILIVPTPGVVNDSCTKNIVYFDVLALSAL